MFAKLAIRSILIFGLAATTIAGAASAGQTPAKPKVNPVGVGSSWSANVDEATIMGRAFDAKELKLVDEVDNYFNGIEHMRGKFIQTDAQNQRTNGRFYVQRPGRFHFVYARPSRLVILSDGRYLSIEDRELETVERYSLSSTPFGLLLAKNVDLLKDARITEIYDAGDLVTIAMKDKSGDATGQIKLYFTRKTEGDDANALELREWVVTDAQGLDTRIEVTDLKIGEPADPKLFQPSKIGLPGTESKR